MKHLILTSALFLTATLGFAQNITEPEYKGQVTVINADSTTTLLQKETGEHKAKSSAFALVPIPGASLLDRTKAYLTVKGAESPNKISSKKFSLIIRVKDNSEEPKNAFGIFKFETKKKERRFKMADIGFGSASATTNFTTVDYEAKKYAPVTKQESTEDDPMASEDLNQKVQYLQGQLTAMKEAYRFLLDSLSTNGSSNSLRQAAND